jgi:uncharacterized protein YkwD
LELRILSRSAVLLVAVLLSACDDSATPTPASGTDDPPDILENAALGICSPGASEQQEMLQLINAARAEARHCGADRYEAADPLTWDCKLQQAARNHSEDMATTNFFSHTGSDGLKASSRIEAQGYEWKFWGENIAAGYGSLPAALAAWLDSPGHCANLMSAKFTQVGVDSATDNRSDYGIYWTQVFARPASSP